MGGTGSRPPARRLRFAEGRARRSSAATHLEAPPRFSGSVVRAQREAVVESVLTLPDERGYTSTMKVLTQDLLDEIIRRLATELQPEEIWLFGSHAWGHPDEGSDIDLLVVVSQSDETPVRRAQRAHRCLMGLGVAKDILVKTRAELDRFRSVPSSLEAQILEQGRLVYGCRQA